jgi:hypothetical protein
MYRELVLKKLNNNMFMKTTTIALILALTTVGVYAQDPNIGIALGPPSLGIKIKNNFPAYTGNFARAFTLSNENGTVDFFGLGTFGSAVNGVATLGYGYLGTNSNKPLMAFLPNGNVGIGTTAPNAKLTVAGNIYAREVKVAVDAGADFVFEDSYINLTLKETEQFIKINKHLPGIPPADKMIKDGLNLSEMNIKLLQKIEELTLHLIEQDKRLQKQEAEIESLKKRKLNN